MIRELFFNQSSDSVCAFTTERGAVDRFDPYSGFNCCDYTGDTSQHVAECRAELCHRLGISDNDLLTARQVHSANVAVIDHGILQSDANDRKERLYGFDALVTNIPGVAVGVFTADCVPMLFADMRAGVVAAAHAGWKGTAYHIATATVDEMLHLGASVEDIQVIFGPSICQSCFEVGDEVVDMFERHGLPIGEIIERNHTTGKAHIDLVGANTYLLLEKGIRALNICDPGLCTKCNHEKFFSARRLGINSGRQLNGVFIR